MTLNQFQYIAVILNQFLYDLSLTYVILIKIDIVYKLTNKGRKILTKKRKFWYLQAISKLIHLCYI